MNHKVNVMKEKVREPSVIHRSDTTLKLPTLHCHRHTEAETQDFWGCPAVSGIGTLAVNLESCGLGDWAATDWDQGNFRIGSTPWALYHVSLGRS